MLPIPKDHVSPEMSGSFSQEATVPREWESEQRAWARCLDTPRCEQVGGSQMLRAECRAAAVLCQLLPASVPGDYLLAWLLSSFPLLPSATVESADTNFSNRKALPSRFCWPWVWAWEKEQRFLEVG